ncbi:MAG: GNAT family N-acetyltransferase [Limisphaerales bacterium]
MEATAGKPVWMIRENLEDLPTFSVPPPFSIRWYKDGDRAVWEDIQKQCEFDPRPFPTDLFDRGYGADPGALPQRLFFLLDERKNPIGTATAWLDETFDGKRYGRIHWVAIVQEYQGRGLAKPLMTIVCSRLRELGHERACLRTSTDRIRAIRLYAKFGFVPLIRNAQEDADWKLVPMKFSR